MWAPFKKQNKKGFTIIEVMIVLAVAGVIMLVVLLAVPSLQRNSRNTQRKSDATHLAAVLSEWQGNHGGTALTKTNDSTQVAGPDLTNENFAIMTKPAANATPTAFSAAPSTTGTLDTFTVYTGAVCTNSNTVAAGSSRGTVVVYYTEPVSAVYQCVD